MVRVLKSDRRWFPAVFQRLGETRSWPDRPVNWSLQRSHNTLSQPLSSPDRVTQSTISVPTDRPSTSHDIQPSDHHICRAYSHYSHKTSMSRVVNTQCVDVETKSPTDYSYWLSPLLWDTFYYRTTVKELTKSPSLRFVFPCPHGVEILIIIYILLYFFVFL